MASNSYLDYETEHDDIDEDLERLRIVLQDDNDDPDDENEEELQILEQNAEEYYSHASASRPSTSSSITASSFPTTSMCTDADDFRFDPSSINADSCLAMNRAYQEVLLDVLRQVEMGLVENRARQRVLEEEREEGSKKTRRNLRSFKSYREIMSPYFRDKDGQGPPFNEDVNMKSKYNEEKQHVKPRSGWTREQRKQLLNAIRRDALEQNIRPLLNRLEIETDKIRNCKTGEEIKAAKQRITDIKRAIEDKQQTPADDLLKNVDSSKIDFMKIGVTEFKGKVDQTECESLWRNVLHPDINRETWNKEEDDLLLALAEKHNKRDWEIIAAELGTRRTAFQCLQHYQQKTAAHHKLEWSTEEDELLREVIDTCKFGMSKIQFNQVAYYLDGRNANECRARWHLINPEIKRGKWNEREDCILVAAVHMHGEKGWTTIRELVPGRTAGQCRDRWLNCLDPNLSKQKWNYDEDKQLIKLHREHGKNWSLIARSMPGRTDNTCGIRFNRLEKWRKYSEEFYHQPLSVQKGLLGSAFEFGPQGQILSRAISKQPPKKKPGRKKVKQEPDVKDEPMEEDTEEQKEEKQTAETAISNSEWMEFSKDQDISSNDYHRQWLDIQNNDIVVPRPPPIRRYTARSFNATWKRRERMTELVQLQMNQENISDTPADQRTIVANVASALSPFLRGDDPTKESINEALRGRLPSEMSVRDLLKISRGIDPNLEEPRGRGRPRKTEDEEEIGYFDDDDRESDSDIEAKEYDTSSEEDNDKETSSEEEIEEEAPLPKVAKGDMSEKQRKISNERKEKLRLHGMLNRELRELVGSQCGHTRLVTGNNRRASSKYSLFPQGKKPLVKGVVPNVDIKMARKSLVLLMRTIDMDGKVAYQKAKQSKRRTSAMALLKSTKQRTRRQKLDMRGDPEVQEISDNLLELETELGMANVDEEGDTNGEETEDEATSENYDKVLPYIPPNQTNIRAMKTLLLQHRCIIDSAGQYFDPDELKSQLYNIKKRGPNPLMRVFSSLGTPGNKSEVKVEPTPIPDDVIVEPTPIPDDVVVEDSSKKGRKRKQEKVNKDVLKDVKETKAYKQLKGRFQSVFTWPALMSTVQPPTSKTPLPPSLRELVKHVEQQETEKQTQNLQQKKRKSTASTSTNQNTDDVSTETDDVKDVVLVEEEEPDVKEMSEEQVIERLVQKIMAEYKAKRDSTKRYLPTKKRRKQKSEEFEKVVYARERMKILKRLGLFEKMNELQRKRLGYQITIATDGLPDNTEVIEVTSDQEEECGTGSNVTVGTTTMENAGTSPTKNVGKSSKNAVVRTTNTDIDESPKKKMVEAKSPKNSTCTTQTTQSAEDTPVNTPIKTPVRVGRHPGSKTTCFHPPDENTRRSSRLDAKGPLLEVKDPDPPKRVYRRRKNADSKPKEKIENKRLKRMIPEKMGNLAERLDDLPLMKGPLPESRNTTQLLNGQTATVDGEETNVSSIVEDNEILNISHSSQMDESVTNNDADITNTDLDQQDDIKDTVKTAIKKKIKSKLIPGQNKTKIDQQEAPLSGNDFRVLMRTRYSKPETNGEEVSQTKPENNQAHDNTVGTNTVSQHQQQTQYTGPLLSPTILNPQILSPQILSPQKPSPQINTAVDKSQTPIVGQTPSVGPTPVQLGQTPIMVAIPVTVGDTQQLACVPLYPDSDGKLCLPGMTDSVAALNSSVPGLNFSVPGLISSLQGLTSSVTGLNSSASLNESVSDKIVDKTTASQSGENVKEIKTEIAS